MKTERILVDGNNSSSIDEALTELKGYVTNAVENGYAAHDVEKHLYKQVLSLGGKLLQQFFNKQGTGDLGKVITLKNGEEVNRLNKLRKRKYRSILGTIEIERTVYAEREGGKLVFIPLDARLSLPMNEQSHVLQEMNQYLAMEMSYRNAKKFLENFLPLNTTVDTMERVTGQNSQYVEAYRQSQPEIDSAEEGDIIVVTSDAKGIPIKNKNIDRKEKITEHKSSKPGPKPNTKRMAVVGGIYSIDRYVRHADELVEVLFKVPCDNDSDANSQKKPSKRPRPQHKRLAAFLDNESNEGKVPLTAASQTFDYLKNQYSRRNGDQEKEVVFLMDGQKSLWKKKKEFFGKQTGTEIIDLIHVNGYLWDIAKALYPHQEAKQLSFMKERVLRVLRGKASRVIGGIRQMATKLKIPKEKLKVIHDSCNYLENNKHRMRYNEYLEKGYPIATGIIEGACRHYIKDRMERSGMRWVMSGAQAMLHMRSIFINEDWEDFTEFKIKKETELLYQDKNILEAIEWPMAA